jgi:RecA/RadA recombinase
MHMFGAAIRSGAVCGLIEGEEASDRAFFRKFSQGCDPDNIIHMDPDTLEDMWIAIENFIDRTRAKTDRPIFIGVDSLAGFSSMAEMASSFDDPTQPGVNARKNREAFRKLKKKFAKERVVVVFINQETAKIGSFGFGEKTTTGGGSGPKFFTSIRLKLDKVKTLKGKSGEEIGMQCQVMIYKNRFDGRGKKIEYPIYFESGIGNLEGNVDYLYKRGFLGKTQGYVIWNGERMRRQEFVAKLHADTNLQQELKNLLYEKFHGPAAIVDDPDIVEGVA